MLFVWVGMTGSQKTPSVDASRLPAVHFWVFGYGKGRLLFQTALVSAIDFAGVIAFGYSSVSGGLR